MLSVFPFLLSYQFFAIALLRVAAGLTLLYVAYHYATERGDIARARFPLVGHIPQWLALFGAFVVFCASVLMLIGLFTQVAVIVSMIVALKDTIFAHRYPAIMPLSAVAAALLLVICLSLHFLGACAFAFDQPI